MSSLNCNNGASIMLRNKKFSDSTSKLCPVTCMYNNNDLYYCHLLLLFFPNVSLSLLCLPSFLTVDMFH